MSLAPAEQRALDKIADALRHSDRRLARMLTRFKVPLARGGLVILIRRPRRLRRLIVLAAAVTAAALLIVAILRSPAMPVCSAHRGIRSFAAAVQASNCSRLRHERHAIGTAGTGTAGTPGAQGTP